MTHNPTGTGLRFGSIGQDCAHICVDMQRMFIENTAWNTPWAERVLPNIVHLVDRHPSRTVFTRFIPARKPGEGIGTWRRYYERWSEMTVEFLGSELIELAPALARFVPPAQLFDKWVYSPWFRSTLDQRLRSGAIDTLIISGGETDVCVLATVLGAVDRGYRTILVTDALCSSCDETHEASLSVYQNRYSEQVEAISTEEALDAWRQ
jgi:nicotinamidase-related amidase